MKFEIAEETIDRVTHCTKELNCLIDNEHRLCPLCPVERCVDGKVHFIKCLDTNECYYRNHFGISHYICTCPVRKEIYNKYQV
jgi:hypothetical protein